MILDFLDDFRSWLETHHQTDQTGCRVTRATCQGWGPRSSTSLGNVADHSGPSWTKAGLKYNGSWWFMMVHEFDGNNERSNSHVSTLLESSMVTYWWLFNEFYTLIRCNRELSDLERSLAEQGMQLAWVGGDSLWLIRIYWYDMMI